MNAALRAPLLALLLLPAAAAAPAAAQERPRVAIPRLEAAIRVDGVLDEPAWQEAARLSDFRQYEPVDGRPAEERTEVLVWYAPDAIHFGIRAFDSQPGTVRATRADRDNIDNDDHVVLYLDTFNDRRRAFFFGVNPLGVQHDGVRTEGAATAGHMFGGNVDNSPDFIFQSRGQVTAEGYVVEVRIPFKSLRFPGSGPQEWGLQVERQVQRTGYKDTWTDVRRANASFLTQAGTITGLHDLHRGVVLEAQPFLTASAPGAFDAERGSFVRGDIEPDVGANFRVGFTNISLDGTINPDFSQVESDAGQVTINERFALFYTEKRPFFLEGIELFSTPNQLVYTRRIADPIAGAKVTGKVGPFAVAHLTAVDQDVDAQGREARFHVTRVRRDFGSSSHVGLTYTDVDRLEAAAFNRVLAADVRYVFAKLYYLEAQWGGSWTRGDAGATPGGTDPETLGSTLWKAEFDRTGRSWGFNYQLNGIGESFEAGAGFVNRPGVVSARAMNRLTWYGRPGGLLEMAQVFFGPNRIWDYRDFGSAAAIEGQEYANGGLTLRGGWRVGLSGGRNFYHLDPADYAGLEVAAEHGVPGTVPYVPLDEVAGPNAEITLSTPTFQRYNASLSFGTGRQAIFDEGAEGRGVTASTTLALRPTEQLRVAFSTSYRALHRELDDSEFARSIIPRLRAEFQATRAIFFRAIGEYNLERRSALRSARTGSPLLRAGQPVLARQNDGARLDLLASFEPSPGTVAYFGYGSALVEDPFQRNELRRANDGFFFKLAYQFRR